MDSCIYEGTIRHRRFTPVENVFQYRMFMLYLDLSELNYVFDLHPLWSVEKSNVAYFRRKDHLGDAQVTLSESVRNHVEDQSGKRPMGPIRLLTHLSYFGYRFNPVSFYYCFDASDQYVETVVAEINNTPWGEQHAYVLSDVMNEGSENKKRFRFDKIFHVSPFMSMNHSYDWRFTAPGDGLAIQMDNWEDHKHMFDATLVMKKKAITRWALTRVLMQYPFMTLQLTGAIHWQAFRLWCKKAPFYSHPKHTEIKKELEVFHG